LLQHLVIGFAGGFVAELVGIWDHRHTAAADLPDYLKSGFYWGVVVVMSAIGAGLVWLYEDSGIKLAPFLALNIGASAPLILRQLTRSAPDVEPGRTG
jgi:hypothetical protein